MIIEKGFMVGYNRYVWVVIFLQAAGGLIVAVVVKYADNIVKSFATSLSIILSAFISWYFFLDLELNYLFFLGAAIVLLSVYGYMPRNKY